MAGGGREAIVQAEWAGPRTLVYRMTGRLVEPVPARAPVRRAGGTAAASTVPASTLPAGGGVRRGDVAARPALVRAAGGRDDRGRTRPRRRRLSILDPDGVLRAVDSALHRVGVVPDRVRHRGRRGGGEPAAPARGRPGRCRQRRGPRGSRRPGRRGRFGLPAGAAGPRLPGRRRPRHTRQRVPAAQPGLHRAAGSAAPLRGVRARRTDRPRVDGARPGDRLLHLPRHRRRRGQLRRLHRVRPVLPGTAGAQLGRGGRRRLRGGRPGTGRRGHRGRPPPGHPRRQRRRLDRGLLARHRRYLPGRGHLLPDPRPGGLADR